jgi:hypothetical protein
VLATMREKTGNDGQVVSRSRCTRSDPGEHMTLSARADPEIPKISNTPTTTTTTTEASETVCVTIIETLS